MEYQIPCDQCDTTKGESKLIETFDNELITSLTLLIDTLRMLQL